MDLTESEKIKEVMKKDNLEKLIKKLEDMMTASTFAEAGEFETAREILRGERRVLLAMREGEVEKKVLKYALNTCKRIRADMDILYLSTTDAGENPMLNDFFLELQKEGINYQVIQKIGLLREEIKKYTDCESNIDFVVVESPAVERWDREEGLSKIVEKIKCPLVVVDVP
ncbi:MAG: hypothetical protein HXY53_00190 [Nitrospirae bacterium]|nr:hypothetical protein [Nitrospirota bacterium]